MLKYASNRIFDLSNNYIDLGDKNIFCNQLVKIIIYLKNFKFNKYFLFDFFIQLYLIFFSIILLPVATVLYFLNFKIYKISNHSFGDYLLEMYILKKHYYKYKVLVPTNTNYKFNQYEKILFPEIKFIKNFFFSHILNAISLWNFSSLNIYNQREQVIEPKHYIHNQNWNKNILNLREYYIFKYLKKKKLNIENNQFRDLTKKFIHNPQKKIAIINPRLVNIRKNKLRNSDLKKFLKTIKFLKKNNYDLFLFSDNSNFKKFCKNNNIKFFDINRSINKVVQIFIFKMCKLYIGSYSGMGHFTDLFKIKSIYVDEVFYNSFIFNENSYVLPKKIQLNKKILNYRDIVSNNLDNIFVDRDIKNKRIKLININEKELFDATKKILSGKEKKIKLNKIFNYPIIINNLPISYYRANTNLFN